VAEAFNIAEMSQSMDLPFPASTRRASGTVGGVLTDVMSISFSDRILVTVIQNGRLAQWVRELVIERSFDSVLTHP
jgi:proteasome assembly chaperone 3